jgi:hypothetical protein
LDEFGGVGVSEGVGVGVGVGLSEGEGLGAGVELSLGVGVGVTEPSGPDGLCEGEFPPELLGALPDGPVPEGLGPSLLPGPVDPEAVGPVVSPGPVDGVLPPFGVLPPLPPPLGASPLGDALPVPVPVPLLLLLFLLPVLPPFVEELALAEFCSVPIGPLAPPLLLALSLGLALLLTLPLALGDAEVEALLVAEGLASG